MIALELNGKTSTSTKNTILSSQQTHHSLIIIQKSIDQNYETSLQIVNCLFIIVNWLKMKK